MVGANVGQVAHKGQSTSGLAIRFGFCAGGNGMLPRHAVCKSALSA